MLMGWDSIRRLLASAWSWTGTQTFTTVDINGGTIDGATIGASSPSTGVFTTLKATTGAVNGYILQSDADGDLTYVDPATAANSGLNAMVNPKSMAQGIHMTYATSGSSGIKVADNANLDFGTDNFTLVWRGSLPDWTPSASISNPSMFRKWASGVGYIFGIDDTATVIPRVILNTTTYTASASPTIPDGTEAEMAAVVTVGAVNTTVDFYCNGIPLGEQRSAANPGTVSNSESLYTLGGSSYRDEGVAKSAILFNRALTAAEVLDLYRNGIAYSDKWGSQAELIANGTFDSNIDGWLGAGWAWETDGAGGGRARHTAGSTAAIYYNTQIMTVWKRYQVLVTIGGRTAGELDMHVGAGNTQGAVSANGSYVYDTICDGSNGYLYFYPSSDFDGYIDSVSVKGIGATLALEPEGIQPAPGQWLDSSSNKNNATLPAAGASNTRKIDQGRYIWSTAMTDDTTWTSIVPAGFMLESIQIENSTANTATLRLGTTAGGTEAVASISVAASGFTPVPVGKIFSKTADTTLYLSDTGGGWSSCSLTATLFFRRVN